MGTYSFLILSVFTTELFFKAEGKTNTESYAECNLDVLRSYRYIHCFDSQHIPIDTVSLSTVRVPERTSCLVSCNHKRALSAWKKCIEGRWQGSDVNCRDPLKKKESLRRIKRWWWSGSDGDKTPPEITCPPSKTVFAEYTGNAYVTYNLPVALDGNKPDGVRMERTSGISSGTLLGTGDYRVCYKAKDESDNESKECCFYVYVRQCAKINRCRRVKCSTSYNQRCSLCDPGYHPHGQTCEPTCKIPNCQNDRFVCVNDISGICEKCIDDGIIWKRIHRNTSCGAMCSFVEKRACWPGTCGSFGLGRDCSCNDGFETVRNSDGTVADCRLEEKPIIETCRSSLVFKGSEIVKSPTKGSTSCASQQDVFINKIPQKASLTFEGTFVVNLTSPKPEFIEAGSWNYGLSGGRFLVIHKTLAGPERTVEKAEFVNYTSTQLKSLDHQNSYLDIDEHLRLSDGDAICLRFIAEATGFFKTVDKRNSAHIVSKEIFNGKTSAEKDVCFWYDSLPPDHCSNTNTCNIEPIQVESRITKHNVLNISNVGWSDPTSVRGRAYNASGIKAFDISIHKVPHTENELRHDTNAIWKNISNKPTKFAVQLNETGLYEILLEVVDNSGDGGNVKSARRFVLFDNTSTIQINKNKPLLVTTAHIENANYWQTEKREICLNWKDRFYNSFHKSNNLLLPIKRSPNISGVFEQLNGSMTIHGTLNVHGIVKFEYSYKINNQSSSAKRTVIQVRQDICSKVPIQNGDKVEFRVHAVDIMNNTLSDAVVILIDTTVPDIDDLWLKRNKHEEIYVHNSKELSRMKLHFSAFDTESGLKTIQWFLGLTNKGFELGNGTIAVNMLSANRSCPGKNRNCYCPKHGICEMRNYSLDLSKVISQGQHNREYYFTIVATNNAGLRSVQHLEVLIDESPPTNGTVMEGRPGETDIDFTSAGRIQINWNGFIDHESGISHYEIFLGKTCIPDAISINDIAFNSTVFERRKTTETSGWFNLPDEGHFVFTVISFNNALEPSPASCSDGIFYEKSSDVLVNVASDNFYVDEGIACLNGTPWLITEKLRRVRLGQHPNCANKCINVTFPNFLENLSEEIPSFLNDTEIGIGICSRVELFKERVIFITTEFWEITWNTTNHQIVQDFEIGIGTNPTLIYHPDIKPYTATLSQTRYRSINDGVGNQQRHFVFLKTKFKSGEERVLPIGPLILDLTPPVFKGEVLVAIDGPYIFIGWNNNVSLEMGQNNKIKEMFYRIGASKRFATPLLQYYDSYKFQPDCPFENTVRCTRYPINRVRYNEGDTDFFVELYIYNHVGISTKMRSKSFSLPSRMPPGHVVIIDVDPESNSSKDIDFQINNSTICFLWKGFAHHQRVSVSAGVGLSPNSTEVIPYTVINNSRHCFRNITLTPFTRYYSVVRANSSGGFSYAASNGVILVNIDALDANLKVMNGKGECMDKNLVTPVIKSLNNESILIYTNLSVLAEFTMFIKKETDENSNESNIIDVLHGFEVYEISYTDLHQVIQMVALRDNAKIKFKGIILSSEELTLYKCQFDEQYTFSQNEITFAWMDTEENDYRPTHFEISMVTFLENKTNVIQSTKTDKRTVTLRNITLIQGEKYFGVVKACFSRICSKPVFGSAVELFPIDWKMNISAKMFAENEGMYKIDIRIAHNSLVLKHCLMRWTLAMNSQGSKRQMYWNYFPIQTKSMISINISRSELKTTSPRYLCVQKIYSSWISPIQCVLIQDTFDYNSSNISIFIVDTKNPELENMRAMSHSTNLGTNAKSFENGNLLYTTSKTIFASIIARNDGRHFEAYLMRKQSLPRNKEDCDSNKYCLHYTQVQDGYISYPGLHVQHNDELFICIRTQQDSENRTGEQSETCSEKLKINDMPPSNVGIKVKSSLNGYMSTMSFLDVEWTVPDLNVPLLEYKYCIGSSPGLDDVLPYASSLCENRATIANVKLNHGSSYFVSVKAVDRSGQESLSISSPITIDLTPPIPGKFFIGIEEKSIKDSIPVVVEDFQDPESGIDEIAIRVAGVYKEYTSHLMVERGHFRIKVSEPLLDGYKYKATLQVSNRAGLSTTVESNEFLVDNSPPIQGYVFDGAEKESDADFQTNTQSISASWGNFTDPHSEISFYKVGLGTTEFHPDVFTFTNVGLKNEFTWKGEFHTGKRYYVLVEACNGVNLCSLVHSDGIILDKTPPVTGLVTIGQSNHESFIPDKSSIAVQWIGFEDPESNIQYFEWCIGTMIYSCDIHEKEDALLSNRIFKSHIDLPVNTSLYATVFAYNNAGLSSTASSRKTTVDITPPVLQNQPTFVPLYVSNEVPKYQYDNSLLKLKWKFEEKESAITEIRIVIKNTRLGEELSNMILRDNIDYTIVPLTKEHKLRDGDSVLGIVSACNMARLCTTETTQILTVDSSRPRQGGISYPMTWTQTKDTYELLVHWYGFSDVESGISHYYITADKTYSGSSLSNGTIEISGNRSSISLAVNVNEFNLTRPLILTVWAVNGAGLTSTSAKVTVKVKDYNYTSTSGQFEIERHSCSIHYCNNDCTCSVVGKKCTHEANMKSQCMPTAPSVNMVDENIIITNLNHKSKILSSGSCVGINFEQANITKFVSVIRYEWSIGLQNELPGVGFFDKEDYPWRDIGLRMSDIECLPPHKDLENGAIYMVYVKAWISDSSFVIIHSNQFNIDTTAPFVKMGKHISTYKENEIGKNNIRFINNRNISLCTKWDAVFSDGKGNISSYYIMLGTQSKADDIFRKKNIGLQSEFCFQTNHLSVDVDYIFSVTAEDEAGMTTSLESSPFRIDDVPPIAGSIFNSKAFKDKLYTSSVTSLGASWNGFQDRGSYVMKYEYRIKQLNGSTITGPEFLSSGFLDAVFIENLNLIHGKSYFVEVRAIDAAGNIGHIATSRPITVDHSPPIGFRCKEKIQEHVNMSVQNDSLDFVYNVDPYVSFLLQFTVADEHQKALNLKINDASIMMNFHFVDGVGFRAEYQHVPLLPGTQRVSLSTNGINFRELTTNVIYCKMEKENESEAIKIKQVKSSALKVTTQFFDLDSGINDVSISIGTTRLGQQILSDYHIFTHYELIDVDIPHNTTIFASVKVTNGAGLAKMFSSQALLIDKTPPVVDLLSVYLEDGYNNDTAVRLIGSFKVTDRESDVKDCYFAIGSSRSSENLQPWTRKEMLQEHFTSEPFNVFHGMRVFSKIRCTNTIGLSLEITSDPVEVILHPPESKTASIEFVQDECTGNDIPTVSDKKSLILHWKGFNDIVPIKNFRFKISEDQQPAISSRSTHERDYVFVNNMDSEDGTVYVAEVVAFNSFRNGSSVSRQRFQVESRQPRITDEIPTVSRHGDFVTVDWSSLFESQSGLNMTYEVNIGSQRYFSDVLHSFKTREENVAFEIFQREDIFSLFVSVRAELCTKQFNIYHGTLPLF